MDTPQLLNTLRRTRPYEAVGVVRQVIGLVIETDGPAARLGDVCELAGLPAIV